jgi:thiamine-phosphate pyrophosphorylase
MSTAAGGGVVLPRVVLVTQDGLPPRRVLDLWPALVAAVPAGTVALSVRYRGMEGQALLQLVQRLMQLVPEAPVLVSRRADVAVAAGCGVHLPGTGIPSAQARHMLGPAALVLSAVHNAAEAHAATASSLVLVSPVWPPRSHATQRPALGASAAASLAGFSGRPWLALGGVTLENVAQVLDAGAWGVGAHALVFDAPDPPAALGALWGRLCGAPLPFGP